jgi:hypothetical protein
VVAKVGPIAGGMVGFILAYDAEEEAAKPGDGMTAQK